MSPQRELERLRIRRAQVTDSLVRTLTTAFLAIILVGAVIYQMIVTPSGVRLNGVTAVLVGWAGVVVGFYFGGHVATNTSQVENQRLETAVNASEAGAVRSEASAISSEAIAAKMEKKKK